MPALPREAQLVLLAATPGVDCDTPIISELTAQPFDWGAVVRLADREKLLPLVWNCLRGQAAQVPAPVREAFQRESVKIEFRMVATEVALRKILALLHANGIKVILLKGAALAVTVYGSFAKRPMGDLDILVAPGDADRAWKLIRDTGWTVEYEEGDEFYNNFHHLAALVDPSSLKIVLEIHRSMLPFEGPFAFDEGAVWDDASSVTVGSVEAWVPSVSHQLLHYSVHFSWSHLFTALGRTVRDIGMVLRTAAVDWDDFTALAQRTNAATCAYWMLSITRTITDAPVPAEILDVLRPRQPRFVSRVLERAFISMGLLRACPSLHASHLLWEAGIQPERSGLGKVRPWRTGELFNKVFVGRVRPNWSQRGLGQARLGTRWLNFARILGTPIRIR